MNDEKAQRAREACADIAEHHSMTMEEARNVIARTLDADIAAARAIRAARMARMRAAKEDA